MFEQMLDRIYYDTIVYLSRLKIELPTVSEEQEVSLLPEDSNEADASELLMKRTFSDAGEITGQEIDFSAVGRNDDCPCGSGKKYKHCHGKLS